MTPQGSVKFGIDCEVRRQFLWFQRRKKEINEGKRIRDVFQEEAYLGYTESNLLEFLFVTGRLGVNCRLCPCISIPVTQVNAYDVTYTRSSPFAPSNCCPSPFLPEVTTIGILVPCIHCVCFWTFRICLPSEPAIKLWPLSSKPTLLISLYLVV